MLNLTENEEKFAVEFCKYYNDYNGDIPNRCWNELGRFRERLGISIFRGAEITNDIEANGYKDLVYVINQDKKDEKWEQIKDTLYTDDYDNETYQALVDEWIYYYAKTDEEHLVCYYYKSLRWQREYDTLFDYRRENSENLTDKDREKLDQNIREANEEALSNVETAINFLDEDTMELWSCTLCSIKAECLHNKNEHLAAVRTAIKGLEYACDENEKNAAKLQISGKRGNDSDDLIPFCGYGIEGRTKEELIVSYMKNMSFSPFQDASYEYNIDFLEMWAEEAPKEIKCIMNGEGTLAQIPYHDRQFIFTVRDLDHIGGCYDETDTIQYVFAIDELPKNISFPVGHPQPNTLYYAHPLRPVYLPFEDAQTLLFHERIQEMCRLFQCLGATKITARCLKGEKVSESVITSNDIDVNGGYKFLGGSFAYSGKGEMKSNRENKNEMFLEQDFSPKKYPYCPDDLIWAINDPEIQTFIQQRLEGSLLSFNKRVSSLETSNLSQNRINEVRGAFQNLMMNVSANYSSSTDRTFSSIDETEWELNVQFKPIEEFDISTMSKNIPTLQKKENILMKVEKFCPMGEDGALGIGIIGTLIKDVKKGDKVIIGDDKSAFKSEVNHVVMFFKNIEQGEAGDEHVILMLEGVTITNIRPGMNIYLDNIETLSSEQNSSQSIMKDKDAILLTDNEEKYKEEVLFCLEDGGTISTDDRKYLERKRIRFNVSEERAQEIEKQCVPSFTDDEKEYIETFKDLCRDGSISDRARRLLDRERDALGISKERAREIEKLIR